MQSWKAGKEKCCRELSSVEVASLELETENTSVS